MVSTGFFSDIFPSDQTMALGSTQLLVKMSSRNNPGGKGGRCVRLTTSPPSRVESGSLNLLEPSGPHRVCYGTPLPLLIVLRLISVFKELKHDFKFYSQIIFVWGFVFLYLQPAEKREIKTLVFG